MFPHFPPVLPLEGLCCVFSMPFLLDGVCYWLSFPPVGDGEGEGRVSCLLLSFALKAHFNPQWPVELPAATTKLCEGLWCSFHVCFNPAKPGRGSAGIRCCPSFRSSGHQGRG